METAAKTPPARNSKVRFTLNDQVKIYGVVTANGRVSEHFATSIWGVSTNSKGTLHQEAALDPVSEHDWEFILSGRCPSCGQDHALDQECET